jgi:hypothetical protein
VHAVKRAFLILIPLTINSLAATAADEEGSAYRNWCRQHALADKVTKAAQEGHIKACIKSLVDADNNPSKKADDEADNPTGGDN